MPIVRYQLRNAYGLSDPSLYSSSKDDPEVILRGLAAAGLTGLLRQIGDLAELAAEIFHDLHKDLMSVGTRAAGLALRVQKVEGGLPTTENDLFCQNSHAEPAYSSGVDWHPTLLENSHLVSQADMPKFILDAYDECRGPPQLFKLDKFDSAGSGACSKRYSDPSFFIANTFYSKITEPETKTKKKKVKVLHSRKDDTAKFALSSDAHIKSRHMVTGQSFDKFSDKFTRINIRPPNYLTKYSEDVDEHTINDYPTDQDASCGLSHFVYEDREHDNGSQSVNQMQDVEFSSRQEQLRDGDVKIMQKVADREMNEVHDNFKNKFLSTTSGEEILEQPDRSLSKADQRLKISCTTEMFSSSHAEEKVDASSDGYLSADVSSDMETFSYVDALTTSDSEPETDKEMKLHPDTESQSANLREEPAVHDGEAIESCFSDTNNKVHACTPVDFTKDLNNLTLLHTSSLGNEGSVPTVHLHPTQVLLTGFESMDSPSIIKHDPDMALEKDKKTNVLSDLSDNTFPLKATLNLKPDVEPELVDYSQELSYDLGQTPVKESKNDPLLSEENNTKEVSPPQPSLRISRKPKGSISLSSLPSPSDFAFSITQKNRAQSLELCGTEPNVMISSQQVDVLEAKEDPPPLPPLPPAGWRMGKFQLGLLPTGAINLNPLDALNSQKIAREHSCHSADGHVCSAYMPLQLQTPNASSECHSSAPDGGKGKSPSQEIPLKEEEVICEDNPSHLEIVQPLVCMPTKVSSREPLPASMPLLMSSRDDAKDAQENEAKALPLHVTDVGTGFCVDKEPENSKRPSQVTKNTADDLLDSNSEGPFAPSDREPPDQPSPQIESVSIHRGSTLQTEDVCSVAAGKPVKVDFEVANGKFNHPKSPLIEAVASHDKSKLRKVSQMVQISNRFVTDQRSAMLEEIRNKAFSLRPTSLSRPSIKVPVTNMKFAAILEKASNIRQALTGSDEEDEDNWD